MPVLPNQPLSSGPQGGVLSQAKGGLFSGVLGAVGFNPFATRQNVATMFNYSGNTKGPNVVVTYPQASQDWRVRVTLAPNSTYFYNDKNNTLLSPLVTEKGNNISSAAIQGLNKLIGGKSMQGQTRVGVVFPYTPQVQVQHTANYNPQKLTHNNYTQYFYENSEVSPITITGDFTVQNIDEGQYLLASIYFFRSITKMFFGNDGSGLAGNPPPLVYLNGYGQYYLPNVPCVCTNFSHTMPPDCDYVDVPEPGLTYNPFTQTPILNSTRLPTTSQLTVTLQPVFSRAAQSQNFSLQDFAAGALINKAGTGLPSSAFGATVKPRNGGTPGNGGFF
jgi:hypothetical protein